MAIQIFMHFNILRVDSDHDFRGFVSGFPEMYPKEFKTLGNVSNSNFEVSDFLRQYKNAFTAF
ncbi:hypothetical protein, partial [Actinobacillus pleuropneumoniae]